MQAIIEIPQSSPNKYEVNPVTGRIRLDRVLYSAIHYPINYGFIPNSWGEDNDPLDVLVLASTSMHPGVEVEGRVLGALLMVDEHGPDAKILGVADADPGLREMRYFFSTSKELQGLPATRRDYAGIDIAHQLVGAAFERYQNLLKRGELHDGSDH